MSRFRIKLCNFKLYPSDLHLLIQLLLINVKPSFQLNNDEKNYFMTTELLIIYAITNQVEKLENLLKIHNRRKRF